MYVKCNVGETHLYATKPMTKRSRRTPPEAPVTTFHTVAKKSSGRYS